LRSAIGLPKNGELILRHRRRAGKRCFRLTRPVLNAAAPRFEWESAPRRRGIIPELERSFAALPATEEITDRIASRSCWEEGDIR
jgi:hypothetical protein